MNKEILNKLREVTNEYKQYGIIFMAYELNKNNISDSNIYADYCIKNYSDSYKEFIYFLSKDVNYFKLAFQLSKEYDADTLEECLKDKDFSIRIQGLNELPNTSESIAKLAVKVLNVKKEDTLADFGCGAGNFINYAAHICDYKKMYGIEYGAHPKSVAAIRCDINGINASIRQNSVFNIEVNKKYNKIYCEPPFGFKSLVGEDIMKALLKFDPIMVNLPRARMSEWAFAVNAINHLNEEGKAICMVSPGPLWNSHNRLIRESLLSSGWIEAVILLPPRLMNGSFIPVAMLVFSRGNNRVRFVNASKEFVANRRNNTFNDENINNILYMLEHDSENSIQLDHSHIYDKNCSLNPTEYLKDEIYVENGVKLKKITDIKRGLPISAGKLDKIKSNVPTKYKYLSLGDIQDGIINNELLFLKNDIDISKEYFVKEGDIIISRNANSIKAGLISNVEDYKIIPCGNFFVVRLNSKKVNPYYLKAYFDSKIGKKQLENIAVVGGITPTITKGNLEEMIVPIPNMVEQNKIAQKYKIIEDEIKLLMKKLESAIEDKINIIEEIE